MTGNYVQGQLNGTAVLFPAELLQSGFFFNPLIVDRKRKGVGPAFKSLKMGSTSVGDILCGFVSCTTGATTEQISINFPETPGHLCARGVESRFGTNVFLLTTVGRVWCRTVTLIMCDDRYWTLSFPHSHFSVKLSLFPYLLIHLCPCDGRYWLYRETDSEFYNAFYGNILSTDIVILSTL